MNRLIIEGKEADLTSKNVNINFQINYIGDISTRNSTFSNTIDLPRTSNNEAIFKMVSVVGSGGRAPYKRLRCTYIQDNITLINGGYLQLTEITPESFKCNVFDGIIDLAERIGAKTLEDLALPPQPVNMSTYTGTFTNTDGYIYALGRYDSTVEIGVFADIEWDINKQAPALFLHSLFDKILVDAGFTYEGDITTNADFKKEVITLAKGFRVVNSTKLIDVSSSIVADSYPFNNSPDNFRLTLEGDPNLKMTVQGDRIVSLASQDITMKIKAYNNLGNAEGVVNIYKNGVIVHTETLFNNSSNPVEYEVTLNGLISGDYIEFEGDGYRYDDNFPSANYAINLKVEVFEDTLTPSVDVKSSVGSTIKQIDILKDIMQRYALILKPDVDNKNHLYFKGIESLLNNRGDAIDLTDRFDYEKGVKYTGNVAKNNTAEYNYVETILNKSSDSTLIVDNEHLPATKTLFKSPWTISGKEREREDEDDNNSPVIPTYDVFLWKSKLEKEGTPQERRVYEELEIKNRIFRVDTYSNPTKFVYLGNVTTVPTTPILSLNSINMDNFLLKNYPSFNNLMNDYKEITVQMNLNTIDLLKMDFFKLVYLKQYQAYFYLQRYTNNGEVKLLQINKFI